MVRLRQGSKSVYSGADEAAGQYLILSEEEAMKLDDPVAVNGKYIAE